MTKQGITSVGVVGAGAMGAMYAQHFSRAGFDISFLATAERAQRLRQDRLTVNGKSLLVPVLDPALVADLRATPTAGSCAPPLDLIIVAVKSTHLADACQLLPAFVGPHTTIISVLNGLDSERVLAEQFGPERVLQTVAFGMDAQREGNQVQYRQAGRLDIGEAVGAHRAPGEPSPQLRRLTDALDQAGLAWRIPPNIVHSMWWKFMANVGVNQASAVMQLPYGAFVSAGPARSLMGALQAEAIAVAQAEGVHLGRSDVATWESVLANQPPEGLTSMYQDVAAGRPTEVDIFAGRVIELGRRHGIATPYNQAIAWILGRA